ncbi:ABC transporter ATP-binding protein/permease, partial [Candidatus Bathyarchaeota archaeon]|nr:ABC transporter ATP-binding protein/permease [Candidatus Bathyarchaeota archaeon]
MGWHWHYTEDLLTEREEKKIPDRVLVRRLIIYLSCYKRQVIMVSLMLVTMTLTDMFQPLVTTFLIDIYLNPPTGASIFLAERLSGVMWIVLLLLALALLNLAANRKQMYLFSWLSQKLVYDLRQDMMKRFQELSIRFFAEGQTGDMVSRVTNDVDALESMFNSMIPTLVSSTISIVGFTIIMAIWNIKLTLITLATLLLFVVPVSLFGGRARQAFSRTRRGIAGVSSRLEESVSGMRVIQSLTREDRTRAEFGQANVENRQANIQATRLFASFGSGIDVIVAVATSIVLWFSVNEAIAGDITLGIVFGFTLYLTKFFEPIIHITIFYNTYQGAMDSMERIVELLDMPLDIRESSAQTELPQIKGRIEYRDVTFGYDPAAPVLNNINIQIEPTQTVAIVGPTGAGKSSMVNLLCRFYDPQKGEIYVDGVDTRTISLKSLRRQMGIVLQDTFLFPTTVRENICYGKLNATDEEVIEAAKLVGAHEFIQRLPEGYSTTIQEGATN